MHLTPNKNLITVMHLTPNKNHNKLLCTSPRTKTIINCYAPHPNKNHNKLLCTSPRAITIINCYVPHPELTKQKPKETERFYDKFDTLIQKHKNKSSILIVAGDMNACVENYSSCIENTRFIYFILYLYILDVYLRYGR